MAGWVKALLFGCMLGWTGLTVAAGWFAVQGAATGSPGESKVHATAVTTSIARTPRPGATRPPPTTEVTSEAETATPMATPTVGPTSIPRREPPPRYAQSAGPEGSAVESDVGATGIIRDAALTAAKGVIVLDPGHGRGDPGAVHHLPDGTPNVLESESNLRNAQLIRDELLALGYDVYLTRDDAGRGPNGPLVSQFITSDLLWRVQLAAAVDADVYLAIHGNGASVTSISGPETWYCGKHEQGSANEELAAMVQRAMMDSLHEYGYFPPDRGIMEDAERHHSGDFCQFVVTRENTIPSALLEFLFLSNDDDARVLADDRAHVVLSHHVAQALDRFLTERAPGR